MKLVSIIKEFLNSLSNSMFNRQLNSLSLEECQQFNDKYMELSHMNILDQNSKIIIQYVNMSLESDLTFNLYLYI